MKYKLRIKSLHSLTSVKVKGKTKLQGKDQNIPIDIISATCRTYGSSLICIICIQLHTFSYRTVHMYENVCKYVDYRKRYQNKLLK